nr:epoxyqueuosine reductase [uncultured Desulfuromonas sp.]
MQTFEQMVQSVLDVQEYFSPALFGYADLNDVLFERFKKIIGPDHMTPREVLACRYGAAAEQGTVIVWILPIIKDTILANRQQRQYPSQQWAHTRHFGEQINQDLRRRAQRFFSDQGFQAAAPLLLEQWQADYDTCTSNWSERHAAFVAGMGSFGLSDAFISDAGVAHRVGSVVTSAVLPRTRRISDDPYARCSFYQDGSCGVCIKRCPAAAISSQGHDKRMCHDYTRTEVNPQCNERFGVDISGCGLCTTAVPCEQKAPKRRRV